MYAHAYNTHTNTHNGACKKADMYIHLELDSVQNSLALLLMGMLPSYDEHFHE